jgi:hypothetical protein
VSVLDRGQAAAERMMVDTCTIRRVTGTTTDDFSGTITPTYTTLYTGKCRLQQVTPRASRLDAGEDSVLLQPFELSVPIAVTGIEPGDQATVNSSQDPDLAARAFLVRTVTHKTNLTARRLGVEERTA